MSSILAAGRASRGVGHSGTAARRLVLPEVINLCNDDGESTAQLTFLFDLPAEVLQNILVLLLPLDKKSPALYETSRRLRSTTFSGDLLEIL